jgi:ribosomal protein S18 acetylase RimI-like enzyme
MTATILIRKVNIDEAETLLQLSRQTFFDAFAAINAPADMEAYASVNLTLQKITGELQNPHTCFYFAVYQDDIIGYLKLNTSSAQTEPQNDQSLELERIYISAKHQGNKFGEQLLSYAIATAKQAHCKYIWLGVWQNNHNAIRFYQRHGFTQFGNHYFMLGNDKQTDILMKKDLQ